MNVLDHFPQSLQTVIWVKNTYKNYLLRIRIRDPAWKNSDPQQFIKFFFISIRIRIDVAWVRAPMVMKLTKNKFFVNSFHQMY
jgi:hypothetical protein